MDRRTLRRMFLSTFESEGLDYARGGCQVVHPDVTWSISLVVDGTGARAPYRLFLGATLPLFGELAPRKAEDCYLFLPLGYERGDGVGSGAPRMPDAAFPDWSGTDDDRTRAIAECVASVVRYARRVGSLSDLREHYNIGDYDDGCMIAPMRELLSGN